MKMRLNKFLASNGYGSRRRCDTLIETGKVRINNMVVNSPSINVDPKSDKVECLNKPVESKATSFVYLLLNKPKGYICSHKRINNSKLVYDLFDCWLEKSKQPVNRLFTAGRLDKDTTGLILVTNDGAYAQKVIHPSSNLAKEYIVKTNYEIKDSHLKKIAAGAFVEDVFIKPKKVQKVRRGTLKIIVTEGKKHEVRKLVARAKLEVIDLKRVRIGNLRLGNLPIGAIKSLSKKEALALFE